MPFLFILKLKLNSLKRELCCIIVIGLPSGSLVIDLFVPCFQDNDYGAEEVANLRSLVVNLRQLLDLHRKYKCRLSLSVFEKVCGR